MSLRDLTKAGVDISENISTIPQIRFPIRWIRKARYSVADDWTSFQLNGIGTEFRTQEFSEWEAAHSLFRDERAALRDILSEIRSDDCVWDIGANIGVFTCFSGESAEQVLSFEPNNDILPLLKANVNHNDTPAELVPIAIGDTGGSGTVRTDTRFSEPTLNSNIRTADTIADEYAEPDILKIDVEGFENNVLRGAERTLEECRVVYIETHPQYGTDVTETISRVEDKGFKLTWLRPNFLKAHKKT